MTRPTVVVLCSHGEAKPHVTKPDTPLVFVRGSAASREVCPGGRVLEQAIIIERDTDGEWPEWIVNEIYECSLEEVEVNDFLDALLEGQGSQ